MRDLGVEEEARAVRGDGEGAAELSARGDARGGGLGRELLHGEEEGHALATRELSLQNRVFSACME